MQQQQQRAHQRQSQVQKRSDDSVGSNNVARDILSKYGQGKSSGNNGTRPTERSSSDHPPVDASPPPRPSPNGTRHSASLRMKARSRSPANRRSHPQSNPTTSKSESPLAESEQNQGTDTDPVPASSDAPSSANNNPSDRRNGGKQGGIAARIAMFEKNNAGTPPRPLPSLGLPPSVGHLRMISPTPRCSQVRPLQRVKRQCRRLSMVTNPWPVLVLPRGHRAYHSTRKSIGECELPRQPYRERRRSRNRRSWLTMMTSGENG